MIHQCFPSSSASAATTSAATSTFSGSRADTLTKPQNFDAAKRVKWNKEIGLVTCDYGCMQTFCSQQLLDDHKPCCPKNLLYRKVQSDYINCAREGGGVSTEVLLENNYEKMKRGKVGYVYNGPYRKSFKKGAFML